jgi:AcrR family transcriptional regulator
MTNKIDISQTPEDQRVDRILHAALDEFGQRGFASAREGEIARMAGVSAATVRHFFPSKEELFREVVRSTIIAALQAIEPGSLAPAADSAVGRLREFIAWFWRTMDEPDQGALLRLSMGELPRFPELAVFHAVDVMGRAAHQLERILIHGAAHGEFRISDPRTSARVILATLVTHAHWFAYPEIYAGLTGVDRPAAEAAVVEVLVETLRNGRHLGPPAD